MRQPRVDILVIQGCPNEAGTRALVARIADELHVEPVLRLTEVRHREKAHELRFLGSPTVRVNGRDVEPGADEREDFALACRVYRGAHGLSGQPDEGWVRDALEVAS